MVLNKRGQIVFYTLMLSIVIVIIAMALVPVVNDFSVSSMNSTSETQVGLDCANETVSDYIKGQCILQDATTPYFFFGLIGIALLIIGARVVIG